MTELKVEIICKKRWWFEAAYRVCFWGVAYGLLDSDRALRWLFVHGFYNAVKPVGQ